MFDAPPPCPERPIGIFVHHQGRGHIERAAHLANALPARRPVVLFCADPDAFPSLRAGVTVVRLPSLFEPTGAEPDSLDWVGTPDVLHCAPLGWPGIREATAILASWFQAADPALFISDVSAELALFARICSVPHVMVLQHGDRRDPGHRAAYAAAAGLLAPCAAALAQPDWDSAMRAKTCFAGGLGVTAPPPARAAARASLGIAPGACLALVVSGGGGDGISQAPLGVAARAFPDMEWVTIGRIAEDWHATLPANLTRKGWVADPETWIAAADLVISSAGNTLCHQILAAGVPWLVGPEWRYFDEQILKADALDRAGAAVCCTHWPASAQAWRVAVADAFDRHDRRRMQRLFDPDAAAKAAAWLEDLIARLWHPDRAVPRPQTESPTP